MGFFISDAIAAATPAAAQAGPQNGLSSILMLVGFAAIFYLLILRPQSKRAKEQRTLMSALSKGDEVVSSGGLLGRINKVTDDFVVLEVANGVEMVLQKGAIVASLPKGTLKAIER